MRLRNSFLFRLHFALCLARFAMHIRGAECTPTIFVRPLVGGSGAPSSRLPAQVIPHSKEGNLELLEKLKQDAKVRERGGGRTRRGGWLTAGRQLRKQQGPETQAPAGSP